MKKILNKYIKKPLCYSAISALFLTETSIASVYELMKGNGNLELKGVFVDNGKIKVKGPEGFKKLVENLYRTTGKQNRDYSDLPDCLKAGDRVGVTDNFSGEVKSCVVDQKKHTGYIPINPESVPADKAEDKLKKNEVSGFYGFDSQMLGAAVFWEGAPGQGAHVYVAKKIDYRQCNTYGYKKNETAVTAEYDENTPESFKKRTDVDHTERQLVAAILSENGLDKNSGCTMCIYTKGHPCINDSVGDAGGISCVNYYKKLKQAYPKIKFHVYFSKDDTISKDDIDRIKKAKKIQENSLYDYQFIKGLFPDESPLFSTKKQQNSAFSTAFKCDSAYLQYLLRHLNWYKIGDSRIIKKKERQTENVYDIVISSKGNERLEINNVKLLCESINNGSDLGDILEKHHAKIKIEAIDSTSLKKKGKAPEPIIPIDDFNLAYNDGEVILDESDDNNLQFEPLGLDQKTASVSQETQG